MGGELECVTSSAGCFVQGDNEMRQEVDSRDDVMHSRMSDW